MRKFISYLLISGNNRVHLFYLLADLRGKKDPTLFCQASDKRCRKKPALITEFTQS